LSFCSGGVREVQQEELLLTQLKAHLGAAFEVGSLR
jgi:hypothetical protein